MEYSKERYHIYLKYKNSGNYDINQLKEIDLGLDSLSESDVEIYGKSFNNKNDFYCAELMQIIRLGLEIGFNLPNYVINSNYSSDLIVNKLIGIILDKNLTKEEKQNKINLIIIES